MRKSILFFQVVIILLFIAGCNKSSTPPPPPTLTITGINPASGIVGTKVTITGTAFSTTASANTISFNGVAAVVSAATATMITTTVPAGGNTGSVTIKVGNNIATGPLFTVTSPSNPPTITSFSPGNCAYDTTITITGTNFDPSPAADSVKVFQLANGITGNSINVTNAVVTSATPTKLTVKVPGLHLDSMGQTGSALPTSQYYLSVTTSGGTISSVGNNLYTAYFIWHPTLYTCGVLQNDTSFAGKNTAVYWINGGAPNIVSGGTDAVPNAIQAVGADVYMAGVIYDANKTPHATYWKNNIAYPLGNAATGSYASGLQVVGSDVYVTGYTSSIGGFLPVYWKNQTQVVLSPGFYGQASGIQVVGSDVYISGTLKDLSSNLLAVYWKNNNAVNLKNGGSANTVATCIKVVGGNVYAGGQIDNNAACWINGIPTVLHNIDYSGPGPSDYVAGASSIDVIDGTVITCGFEQGHPTPGNINLVESAAYEWWVGTGGGAAQGSPQSTPDLYSNYNSTVPNPTNPPKANCTIAVGITQDVNTTVGVAYIAGWEYLSGNGSRFQEGKIWFLGSVLYNFGLYTQANGLSIQ